ncbi:nickel ABC transporter substrate-binding protein [Campylobacter sp. 9BO]|uniref:nickel ABC transporter substrate-binding protein n=1 Tax=Campylobacter sp. 9BO TaxID=3424759 RepID=UPI003D3583DF
MKKIFLCVAFLLSTLFSEQTLNFAMSKNVGELNPHLYSPNQMFAQDMVYESLVRYGDDSKIYPHLALSWEILDDGKVYKFKLREDVSFSNGEKFNAAAVKANFDAILDNRKRHAWLELANIITDVKVVGEYEVELFIKNAYEPTLKELSLIRPFRFIAPSAMMDGKTKDGIKSPIGTGVWKLVKSEQGISDEFVKNDLYWGEKPHFDKLLGKVIPEPATKIIALKTGEISLIYGDEQVPLDTFNSLKNEFGTISSEPLFTLAVALNSNKFPTDSKAVRMALNMAIDKDLIMKKIFFDIQKKADFLFNKSFENTDINAQPYAFDLKKANEILENDGWVLGKDKIRYKDGKALKIELIYIGTNGVQKSMAEIMQSYFKKIGAVLDIKADESSIFYKKQRTGDFGAIFNSTWGAPYDPVGFLASMRLPSHADYQAQLGLKDKALIDEKIGQILSSLDPKAKRELTHEVLNKLHEEAIYIPITYETNKVIFSKNLSGVTTSILKNHVPFDKMKFIKSSEK